MTELLLCCSRENLNMINATVATLGELSLVLTRANGKTEDYGIVSQGIMAGDVLAKIKSNARRKLLALGSRYLNKPMNLVTSAGIAALATNFLPSPAIALSSFSWIDLGTGTSAATISDVALQSAAGTARVNGTQSNPTAGSYKVVGTVTFSGSLAITEF